MIDRSPRTGFEVGRRPAAAQAVPKRVDTSVSAKPAASRARGFGANKVNAPPLLLIFQCHASAMTPWLNRGAKKTNEPTIPLILQAFGWLNRAALARAADRTSAAAAHDRSFAPNRIRSWTSASRRPGGAKAGRPQCQCEAGGLARARIRRQ